MSTFTHKLFTFIDEKQLIPKDAIIVLGLSGGPDSVFLFHILLELKKAGRIKEVIATHLDHEWRSDSKQDTVFCRQLAQTHDIPFESKKLSELDTSFTWDGSQEEIGRKARRFFFESIAKQYAAHAIALGQHAQDQQETFFIRLLRGTSLSGLCGIWPKRGLYIRPLLQTDKADILAYLDEHAIAYLEDPSNVQESFLRNRIRKDVIPALKSVDDRFDITFAQTVDRLQQTEQYLNQHARQLFESMSSQANDIHEVSIAEFRKQPTIMQSRILVIWLTMLKAPFSPSQSFMDEIIRFLDSDRGGSHQIHDLWTLKKKSGVAWIEKSV